MPYVRRLAGILASVLALGAAAVCQGQAGPGRGAIVEAMGQAWGAAKRNIQESVQQMPESGFAFKPTESVRTFGAILAHLADANYVSCAAALGERPPHAEGELEKSATTKAAIVRAVTESLAYCDAAYYGLADRKLGERIALPYGMGNGSRAYALAINTSHMSEHYGNLVTYFRLQGMVPPSSRR